MSVFQAKQTTVHRFFRSVFSHGRLNNFFSAAHPVLLFVLKTIMKWPVLCSKEIVFQHIMLNGVLRRRLPLTHFGLVRSNSHTAFLEIKYLIFKAKFFKAELLFSASSVTFQKTRLKGRRLKVVETGAVELVRICAPSFCVSSYSCGRLLTYVCHFMKQKCYFQRGLAECRHAPTPLSSHSINTTLQGFQMRYITLLYLKGLKSYQLSKFKCLHFTPLSLVNRTFHLHFYWYLLSPLRYNKIKYLIWKPWSLVLMSKFPSRILISMQRCYFF